MKNGPSEVRMHIVRRDDAVLKIACMLFPIDMQIPPKMKKPAWFRTLPVMRMVRVRTNDGVLHKRIPNV
tara:strand:- start:222 stop:428 length:207 start_codon:yes stop_codon:yes gene_type:complete